MLQCQVCGSEEFHEELFNEEFQVDGRIAPVEDIPAMVCNRCGEKIFSKETAEEIRRLVRGEAIVAETSASYNSLQLAVAGKAYLKKEAQMKIIDVEGIGPAYAEKLKKAGVTTTGILLKKGATPKGRKELADKTGISDGLILQWVNHVDLYRIKGVGSEYSDLLEAAGVDTIPELSQRRADNLVEKMAQVNKFKKLVRRLPVKSQVEDWIQQAKKLPRVITY